MYRSCETRARNERNKNRSIVTQNQCEQEGRRKGTASDRSIDRQKTRTFFRCSCSCMCLGWDVSFVSIPFYTALLLRLSFSQFCFFSLRFNEMWNSSSTFTGIEKHGKVNGTCMMIHWKHAEINGFQFVLNQRFESYIRTTIEENINIDCYVTNANTHTNHMQLTL